MEAMCVGKCSHLEVFRCFHYKKQSIWGVVHGSLHRCTPNHPQLDHGIESYGFGDPPFWETSIWRVDIFDTDIDIADISRCSGCRWDKTPALPCPEWLDLKWRITKGTSHSFNLRILETSWNTTLFRPIEVEGKKQKQTLDSRSCFLDAFGIF